MKVDSLSNEYLARTTHSHECPRCHREFKGYRDKRDCPNKFEWCGKCVLALFNDRHIVLYKGPGVEPLKEPFSAKETWREIVSSICG